VPILLVQHISTSWSKASRGGPRAGVRNAVPVALPFSKLVPSETRSVLHEVQFNERTEFTPHEEVIIDGGILPRGKALCITAGRDADGAWALYDYSTECGGAPDRSGVRKRLTAPLDRWIRIVANGRFAPAWDGDWWYEKHVVNVGLFSSLAPYCFTATEPADVFEALAALW
jgi:hypothetical protein